MALTLTITDAGRAALINAQNTGTNAVVIDRIGISSSHATGDLKALTALPNERKRLATFGGEVVADDVLHITLNDSSDDTYSLHAFGVYFSSGVLFAVCTSPERIMEKSASAMLLQSVDITLTTLDTALIEFGPAGFNNPPATIDRMGVVELATTEETLAGTDTTRAVTPFSLGRVLAQWANLFAAKSHSHAVGDIDNLGMALATKADKTHKHDAGETISGTFVVDRIPKLAINWINGLADALADKAPKSHQHGADDINSGTFSIARIPDLAMSKITGLAAALGVKADSQHSHDAADTTSGVFNVGRIPALAMEKITGLANALAAKANLYAPIFEGLITSPNVAIRNTVSSWRSLKFFSGLSERWALMMDTAPEDDAANTGGDLLLTAGMSDGTSRNVMRFDRATQKARFFQTPHVNGYDVHHKGDLRPASNSETLSGALGAERYITPAGLWSFAKSIGPSGYQQIPGTDLIIQWGFSAASIPEGQIHAILPVAFGGGCLTAMAICRNPTSNTGNDFWMQIVDKYLDRIVFLANRSGTGGNVSGYEWLAIGLARGTPNPVYSTGIPPGGGSGGGEYNPEL